MNKKLLFTSLLSVLLLTSCNSYSKTTADKAREILSTNLEKKFEKTECTTKIKYDKFKIKIEKKGEAALTLMGTTKEKFEEELKAELKESFGEESEETLKSFSPVPLAMIEENDYTTYYVSGEKLKIVMKMDSNSMATETNSSTKTTSTYYINEYGYFTKGIVEIEMKIGEYISASIKITQTLSYK